MKKFDAKKKKFWQNDSVLNLAIFFNTLFLNKGFVSAQIVHAWGNQLVPELLLKLSDTFPTLYRHIEHLHEKVWCQKNNFWQNDSFVNLAMFACFACA